MFCSLGGIFSNDTSSQFSAEGVNIVYLEQSQNTSLKSEKEKVCFQLDKMKDHFKINFIFIKIKYFPVLEQNKYKYQRWNVQEDNS